MVKSVSNKFKTNLVCNSCQYAASLKNYFCHVINCLLFEIDVWNVYTYPDDDLLNDERLLKELYEDDLDLERDDPEYELKIIIK